MARINLLPWREELRAERRQQFYVSMVLVAVLAIAVLVVAGQYEAAQIDHQNRRNSYLRENITLLDTEVEEIRDLQRKREQLVERMRIIQELQGNRPIIVRVLDQLVRTIPDGVFYTNLTTKDGRIAIEGVAESNNRVSSLMRRLDASDWLEAPNLDSVRAAPEYGDQAATFNLTVQVQLRDAEGSSGV